MKLLFRYLTFILLISFFFSCKKKEDESTLLTSTFSKTEMLTSIVDNLILPVHEDFKDETKKLKVNTSAFTSSPTTENLEAVQQQWKLTIEAWKNCEIYNFSDIKNTVIHNKIGLWPCNEGFITDFLAEPTVIDEAFIESKGSTSKGLAAIEFFIFDPEKGDQSILDSFILSNLASKRKEYLQATSANLTTKSNELYNLWSPNGSNFRASFIEAKQDGITGTINILTNQLVALTENIIKSKLSKPLGIEIDNVTNKELCESYRSENSLSNINENNLSLESLFSNTYENNKGIGFDDYLKNLNGDTSVPEKITTQFMAIQNAINSINGTLENAINDERTNVEKLNEEFSILNSLLKVEMVTEMGVTLTINDSDGD